MAKNVNNESVDVKGFKGGSTNTDSWESVMNDYSGSIFSFNFTKKHENEKNAEEVTGYDCNVTLKNEDEITIDNLKKGLSKLNGFFTSISEMADDLCKEKFYELIKLEADYENRMKACDNLCLDIRKTQTSKSYESAEEIRDDNNRKVTIFKYKVDPENATFGTIATVWEHSEIAARYAAKLAKAEAERLAAAKAAKERADAIAAKDKEINDLKAQNEAILAALAKAGITL